MVTMPVECWCDGSALRNPGAAGLAYVIKYFEENPEDENAMPEEKRVFGNQGFRLSTNNRMEIMATIYGVQKIISMVDDGTLEGLRQINLFSDSEYFEKAVNQNWLGKWQQNNWMTSGYQGKKPTAVKNKDLWEKVIEYKEKLSSMNINLVISHVPGHSGIELNELADKLAVEASSGSDHIVDEGYEKDAKYLQQ